MVLSIMKLSLLFTCLLPVPQAFGAPTSDAAASAIDRRGELVQRDPICLPSDGSCGPFETPPLFARGRGGYNKRGLEERGRGGYNRRGRGGYNKRGRGGYNNEELGERGRAGYNKRDEDSDDGADLEERGRGGYD